MMSAAMGGDSNPAGQVSNVAMWDVMDVCMAQRPGTLCVCVEVWCWVL